MRKLFAVLLLLPLATPVMADQTIVQKGRRFAPAEVTIHRGESLTFTNDDEFIHQVYAEGLFDSEEKEPGDNLTEGFTNAGTFEVRCHIHPKMKLIVHVN
jgi:plastocyanin